MTVDITYFNSRTRSCGQQLLRTFWPMEYARPLGSASIGPGICTFVQHLRKTCSRLVCRGCCAFWVILSVECRLQLWYCIATCEPLYTGGAATVITSVRRSTFPCQVSRLCMQKCGNRVPKTVKIWNFAHKFAPQGRLVCTIFNEILSVCTRIQIAFKFLIWSV